MIQEVIEKIEREIEIRKNMPHNYEQVDICYGLNQAKEIAKKVLKESGVAQEKIADAITTLVQQEVTPKMYEQLWNAEKERSQTEEFYDPLYTQN